MKNKKVRTACILAAWLVIWQLAAVWIDSKILFAGPAEVLYALFLQVQTMEFWQTVLRSSVRIMGGFLAAFAGGTAIGICAFHCRVLREFLEPAVSLMQSVPVASFVILALIWVGSENLSVLIGLLVVFPMIYRNTIQGMQAADRQLLEMAEVYRIGPGKRLWYLYRPALLPYLKSSCRAALGMAWKSGVAAEVIGVPDRSVGEKLYLSKIYLNTAELFAWTLVIILVSRMFEWVFLQLLELADVRSGKERR